MDYSIIQVLPHLNTLDKEHVKKWAQEFDNLTKLAEIYDDEKLYRLAYQVTDGEARKTLTELKEELGDEYPTFDDITDALLKVKDLTKIEKYDMLKTMVIDRAESIKEFNKTYLELYDSMDDGFKQGIKVTDYLNSIYPRSDACCAVIYDEADSIEKACKSAERAETLLEYKQRRNNRKNNYPPFNMVKYQEEETHNNPPNFQRYGISSRFINQTPKPSTAGNERFKHATPVLYQSMLCYRCGEEGHKGYKCPYSDEQLIKILQDKVDKKKQESQEKETTTTPKN